MRDMVCSLWGLLATCKERLAIASAHFRKDKAVYYIMTFTEYSYTVPRAEPINHGTYPKALLGFISKASLLTARTIRFKTRCFTSAYTMFRAPITRSVFLTKANCFLSDIIIIPTIGYTPGGRGLFFTYYIIQGGARNVIPLIIHITHFYRYKTI